MERPSTPERSAPAAAGATINPSTPEMTRRMEESRLLSKALRDQREADAQANGRAAASPRTSSGLVNNEYIQLAGPAGNKKRPHAEIPKEAAPSTRTMRSSVPSSNRDARGRFNKADGDGESGHRPAKKFTQYVDYNFSAMTDTKGGFLSVEDDPWSKSMGMPGAAAKEHSTTNVEQKPAHLTATEWEKLQLIRKLQRTKAGPFEPGMSVLGDQKKRKKCRECGSLEIDFLWEEVFGCAVCGACKEKMPDKYSLLTKTECREDYLLTEPELKDEELLPHLSRPNPHKTHWHDMMLFLRYQVEEYAFRQKWGSAEALDAEFERREVDKKRRKEAKFKEKLLELKRKTRTDAVRRSAGKMGDKATKFGEMIGGGRDKHVHRWGRLVENAEGLTVKSCLECGMEVEELVM